VSEQGRERWRRVALAAALLPPFGLALSAAAEKSVTVDEYQALPHGLAILRTGDFRLATTTQPLGQVLPALPLLITPARLDGKELASQPTTWGVGRQFARENTEGYHGYLMAGRAVSALVLLVTCVFAWRLSQDLYGPIGGLLTAATAGLSPNLLAHGPLVTPDIYLAASMIGSLLAFDSLLRRPGWVSGMLLGLTLSAAGLAKHTGVLLMAIFPLILSGLCIVDQIRRSAVRSDGFTWRRAWWSAALAVGLAVLAINVGYLFQGTFTPLRNYEPETPEFQAVRRALPGWLPVPLPESYFRGADRQLAEKGYDAYLLGEFNDSGFYEYYLVALLVKTPVVVPLLALLALVCAPRVGRREVPLLVCGGLLLLFFSFSKHKNIGVRYVLFLEPIAAVWIGRLAAAPAWRSPRFGRYVRGAAGIGVAVLGLMAVTTWPDYIAYFNRASGGPAHGHEYLLDSNLDWGQDLITLRRYMEDEGIPSVDLAYFGRVDPAVYGVRYRHLAGQRPQRYVAISANLLWGRMYFMNGTGFWPQDRDMFKAFRGLKPKAVLGYSIYVYDLANAR
jgi:hypothetical protein